MERIIPFAHNLIKKVVTKEDFVVDATCGNGHDTLMLAQLAKFVYGFDIQNEAINNTKNLLNKNNIQNVKLIKDSHSSIEKYIDVLIKAAIFNLGYLPGGDKSITTNFVTTIESISKILDILDKNGLCVIVVYPGHKEGNIESHVIDQYLSKLNSKSYNVLKYNFINKCNSPYILSIEKL